MRRRTLATTLPALAALLAIVFSSALPARAAEVPTQPMSPHMDVTLHAPVAPGDQARAAAIVAAARQVMARYPTVAAAEQAGFTKSLPALQLPIEHFTNKAYALEAWSGHFDAMHPTSLIFKRAGDDLSLVGVMYTANRNADGATLDRNVPLSIATWHRHVAFCAGPRGTPRNAYLGPGAQFGLAGSIATRDACDAAGGTFRPIVYGWMVHVWPTQSDPAKIWAVDLDGSMSHGAGLPDHAGGMNGMNGTKQ